MNIFNNNYDDEVQNIYDPFILNFTEDQVVKYIHKYITIMPDMYKAELYNYDSDYWHNVDLLHQLYANKIFKLVIYHTDKYGNQIKFEYLIAFHSSEPCLIYFTRIGDYFSFTCENIILKLIIYLKNRTHEERIMENRYAEREHFLTLINSKILDNHNNYNDDKHLQADKLYSKKYKVLENPWFHREVLEYIDCNTFM